MPQLDIVTYFPQSFWFTLLFWAGFFYFLYDMFPILINLFKVRDTFLTKLEQKAKVLTTYYLEKIGNFTNLGAHYILPTYRWSEDQAIKGQNLAIQNLAVGKIFNFYYLANRKLLP